MHVPSSSEHDLNPPNTGTIASSRPDVLVVGAGPVGLALACELSRHGLVCRIVDQNEGPSIWSKAAGVNPRTLEAFDLMGVVDDALAHGRPMRGFNFYTGEKRLGHIQFGGIESPYEFLLGLSQRDTELLLAKRLEGFGVHLERSVKLTRFEQSAPDQPDGNVVATLVHADGREETLEVPWMVACDGARSTVRKTLDLPFEGSTFEQSLSQADVRIQWPFPVEDNEAHAFVSPHGAIGALPLLSEGRYRLLVLPGDQMEPSLEYFQQQMDLRGPPGAVVSDPAWMIGFRFHSRIAGRYRVGRIFLAGDAAHIHSPAGAQGMNMGIQDAFNLAWKLALVVRGGARESILDSYEAERRPIGESVVSGTDLATRNGLRMMQLQNSLAQSVRNHLVSFLTSLPVFQELVTNTVGGTGVQYSDSPIVGQHQVSIWSAHVMTSRHSEHPAFRDWLDFGKGPGPGERAPDVVIHSEPGGRLFDLLRTTAHTLLLFDGSAATSEGYQRLLDLSIRIESTYGTRIVPHLVVPAAVRPAALNGHARVVLDPEGALHRRYGARSECLYLIRPDGYIAFRSQPADTEKLLEYLQVIFAS